ncbi:MAG: penicillin-binding protein 2 [Planctomycetota bacterium]|nr:penicillin-binding protein 2 [Planctomycetota bacterium]
MSPPLRPESDRAIGPARPDTVLVIAVIAMTALFAVVFVRVAQLQLAPETKLVQHIEDRVTRRQQVAARGDILDRRGRVLATTRTGYRLFVDPSELKAPYGATISAISEVTGVDADEVGEELISRISASTERLARGQNPLRYWPVGTVLDDHQLEAFRKLSIRGLHLERRSVREMPGGDSVAPVVGKVGIDHEGLLGAELAYDEAMAPSPGHLDYVRDAFGRPMWVEPTGYNPPEKGADVRLTLDLQIQEIAAEELRRGVYEADAAGGRLVMIDPATGDVLAMVDYVRDDMSLEEPPRRERLQGRVVEPDSTGHRYRTIRKDDARRVHPAMGRNRCVEDLYEPGSTFKSFVWASLVERGYCQPDEVFNTFGGRWQTDYGRPIADVTPQDYLTWREVLVYSSNIGMVQGAARARFEEMRNDLIRFGFGTRVNIGLPGESPGLITPQSRWTKYTQTSIASGYEVAVTPLQIVRAFAAFARSGELAGTLPNLRLRVSDELSPTDEVRVRVVPQWVAHLTRDTLRRVGEMMEERARRRFKDEPPLRHSLFAKSGTAEIPRPDGKGYFRGQYNSSFLAGAPAEDPRIVLVVVIDDPGPEQIRTRNHYGTAVAGPVVRRVVRRTLEYLGVPATEPLETPGDEAAPDADAALTPPADDHAHE